MRVTFYGAVREVTGSMHMIATGKDNILLDCGMYQGRRKEADRKNRIMPFDPAIITNVILSHAHIDHSGRLPLLSRDGFGGRIITTRATQDACGYMLPDSAHIQESDAAYLNYKVVRNILSKIKSGRGRPKSSANRMKEIKALLKKGKHQLNVDVINELAADYHLEAVSPLYTISEAEHALTFFEGVPYGISVTVGKDSTCTFYDAGHILGSAISIIKTSVNGKRHSVCFSGDIGRFDKPILKNPTLNFAEGDREIDLLIMESTYGNRLHEPVRDMAPHLKQVINNTADRGGALLIPAFAFGRTQELLYIIHDLYNKNETPHLPVYVDSPLATRITEVFGEHPEMYDPETHADFLIGGDNPFMFRELNFTSSVEESMALMREKKPHIVISAAGMCEAGRILHHLRYKMHNPKNTVLVVGYMAKHTLGRRILEEGQAYAKSGRKGKPPVMRLLNKEYPLAAHVAKIDGFSAHGDKDEMLRFIEKSNLKIRKIALVHGDEDQTLAFADTLKSKGHDVMVPKVGESFDLRH
jgi:metallo-beta-lactamase family protein